MAEADWRTLAAGWFPQLCDPGCGGVLAVDEPHRDYIAAQLKAGVTAATIHQRLVDEHGLDASVASLRRGVRANLPEDARRAQVTVLRDPRRPVRKPRSTTGSWGCGWTRAAGGDARCGRS